MRPQDSGKSVTTGSTLGFALLSLLTRGPDTGYRLAQRIKAPIGHFWTATHSQIYPELARLADAGWVQLIEGAGPGPRAKKTYTLTEAGRAALRAWLVQPPVSQPRSELTLKAYAAAIADPADMAALYQSIAEQARKSIIGYEADAAELRKAGQDNPAGPSFGNYAVLLMGIESQRTVAAWAGWMAMTLRTGQAVEFPYRIPSGA